MLSADTPSEAELWAESLDKAESPTYDEILAGLISEQIADEKKEAIIYELFKDIPPQEKTKIATVYFCITNIAAVLIQTNNQKIYKILDLIKKLFDAKAFDKTIINALIELAIYPEADIELAPDSPIVNAVLKLFASGFLSNESHIKPLMTDMIHLHLADNGGVAAIIYLAEQNLLGKRTFNSIIELNNKNILNKQSINDLIARRKHFLYRIFYYFYDRYDRFAAVFDYLGFGDPAAQKRLTLAAQSPIGPESRPSTVIPGNPPAAAMPITAPTSVDLTGFRSCFPL
jgi:hypothetical protein